MVNPYHFVCTLNPEYKGNTRVVMASDEFGNEVWIRGFTYKEWTCAVTGETIKAGDFAWRPQGRVQDRVRVAAHVFDSLVK